MSGHSKESSEIARVAADRFPVVLPRIGRGDNVARLAEQRLADAFGMPFVLGAEELRVSAKVGIAMFPEDGADAETLFKNAEAALNKAKESNEPYLFYTQKLTERVAERLSLENQLRQALEKNEFVLHYQPKVETQTRRIIGVEALIRWMSPERGLVPPLEFIPLLEETGLILEVGEWALREAVRDHAYWTENAPRAPRVAVNVSSIQLRRPNFVEIVKEAIIQGATPHGLDLEITESVLMEEVAANLRHRLFLARLPREAPGAVAQDRPLLHHHHAEGAGHDDARLDHHLPRALPASGGRGRGRRFGRPGEHPAARALRPDAGLPHQQAGDSRQDHGAAPPERNEGLEGGIEARPVLSKRARCKMIAASHKEKSCRSGPDSMSSASIISAGNTFPASSGSPSPRSQKGF